MKRLLILIMVCFLVACSAKASQQDDVHQKDNTSKVTENDEQEDSAGEILSELSQESDVLTSQGTVQPEHPVYSFEPDISIDMKNAELSELLFFSGYHCEQINELLEERFKYHPTTVVISKDGASIAWMFEGCLLDTTDSDTKILADVTLGRNEHGKYIYLGELIPVEDNVYAAKGTFLPSAEAVKEPISSEVDFYVVFKEDKLYLITDSLETDELKNYSSDGYFKYNK